jgi:hypothetical protein
MPNYEFFCHACKKTFSKSLMVGERGFEPPTPWSRIR